MFRKRKLKRKYIKRLNNIKNNKYLFDDKINFKELKKENIYAYNQARLICNISDTFLFKGQDQKYFDSGEKYFENLKKDLLSARNFIFMEYFIFEEGKFFDSILEILKKKVKDGIEVKIVYDDIGCMFTLTGNYDKYLKSFGIDAVAFSRIRCDINGEFNNRNHRKFTIIDGQIAYTGGINLTDEYINEKKKYGYWKDSGIRIQGNSVNELVRLFLIDFQINSNKNIKNFEKYYIKKLNFELDNYIIPFGDGPNPFYERRVGKTIIQSMIEGASKSVTITTPYLIIDNDMCTTLENAALRGIDIKIILPHIPDKKLVFKISQSFYHRLLDAGVKIFEYEPGFIHSKTYLVDEMIAMIGTINMDYRSLVHHFENGVWFFKGEVISRLVQDFKNTIKKSLEIKKEHIKNNIFMRFICAVFRLIAPLL